MRRRCRARPGRSCGSGAAERRRPGREPRQAGRPSIVAGGRDPQHAGHATDVGIRPGPRAHELEDPDEALSVAKQAAAFARLEALPQGAPGAGDGSHRMAAGAVETSVAKSAPAHVQQHTPRLAARRVLSVCQPCPTLAYQAKMKSDASNVVAVTPIRVTRSSPPAARVMKVLVATCVTIRSDKSATPLCALKSMRSSPSV